jgi:hypothetical protein
MGLFDRLKAAQAARDGVSTEEVIDLTDKPPKAIWGRPSRCPECNDPGYLDHIDLVRQRMYLHCPDCMHKWEIDKSETIVSV